MWQLTGFSIDAEGVQVTVHLPADQVNAESVQKLIDLVGPAAAAPVNAVARPARRGAAPPAA